MACTLASMAARALCWVTWNAGASSRMAMILTVDPAGVLQLPEPAASAEAAADVDPLPGAPVELVELLHAAADSAVATITAKSGTCRLVLIDSPGGVLAP